MFSRKAPLMVPAFALQWQQRPLPSHFSVMPFSTALGPPDKIKSFLLSLSVRTIDEKKSWDLNSRQSHRVRGWILPHYVDQWTQTAVSLMLVIVVIASPPLASLEPLIYSNLISHLPGRVVLLASLKRFPFFPEGTFLLLLLVCGRGKKTKHFLFLQYDFRLFHYSLLLARFCFRLRESRKGKGKRSPKLIRGQRKTEQSTYVLVCTGCVLSTSCWQQQKKRLAFSNSACVQPTPRL